MTVPRFKGDAELLSQRPLQLTASHAARSQRLSLAFFRQTKNNDKLARRHQESRHKVRSHRLRHRAAFLPHTARTATNKSGVNEPTGWPKKLAKLNLLNINRFPTFYHSESGENL